MAGAYRFTTTRAKVAVEGGDELGASLSVTVRDGVARARRNGGTIAEMEVGDGNAVAVVQRNHWRITGTDGTVWVVTRSCGCGGAR